MTVTSRAFDFGQYEDRTPAHGNLASSTTPLARRSSAPSETSSYVLIGALFGLPADIALVISLSKRVRELALGVPGLLLWHYIEGRYHLRRGEPKAR